MTRMSDPRERLKRDILHWRSQLDAAVQMIQVGERVLPDLESQWEDLFGESVPEVESLLEGECADQIEQALAHEFPQSTKELQRFLADKGCKFSMGAITYGIRKLRDSGRIQQVDKEGNLRYYELV